MCQVVDTPEHNIQYIHKLGLGIHHALNNEST